MQARLIDRYLMGLFVIRGRPLKAQNSRQLWLVLVLLRANHCQTKAIFVGPKVDLSRVGPLRLKVHKIHKEGDNIISTLLEVTAESGSLGSKDSRWKTSGWPIR